MVGWHHQINGHESEETPGDCEAQGSLMCCSLWGYKVRHDQGTKQQWRLSCSISFPDKQHLLFNEPPQL